MKLLDRHADTPQDLQVESLRREVDRLSAENVRLTARFIAEEQRASDLMKLLLALRCLHEATDRTRLLDALQEIVINVLGSESMAILARDDSAKTLVVQRSMGVNEGRLAGLRAGHRPTDAMIWAPIMRGGATVGAIVIFGLLEHKSELEPLDLELLDMLSVHAAAALAATAPDSSRQASA